MADNFDDKPRRKTVSPDSDPINQDPIAPNQFEPIKATDIPLSQPAKPSADTDHGSTTPSQQAAGSSQRWVYAAILTALAGVLLLLLATVFQADSTDPAKDHGEDKTASATSVPATIEESPFQKAQRAAARRTAQDILASVLAKQQALEAMNIQQWADEPYQQALAAANEGDTLYRQRQFKAAIAHYETAASLLDKLEAGREPHIAELLAQGLAAINRGQTVAAQQAFNNVLLIAAEQPQALQGLQRCLSLPEVFAATERGHTLQMTGDYAPALAEYTQALQLDPLFQAAITGREEAQGLLDDEQFQAAINQGFMHLHSGALATARQHFKRALVIKPQSSAAQNALLQTDNEIAQRAIANLLNSAQRDENKEQWQAALDTYHKVLSRDAAVTAATVGKIRSAARQQLDAKLERFIHQPLRLANSAVYRQAQQSLADAKQIAQAGPRLKRQVTTLGKILSNAQQPQTVVLHSDNLTRVNIFKLGEFAPFTEKTLQLKPGKYIAEGIRPGYRDVRVEFTVRGAGTAPVVVQCRETI